MASGFTDSDEDARDDDLMPRPNRRDLPNAVRRNRETQAATDERDRERFEAAVEANITAHRLALDTLERAHQRLADELDFDLTGDTRLAAVWQLAGRCIGIARLMLDAFELGYTAEVLHLARALHEADRLIEIFTVPEEEDLLRRWLAGEWVRPGEVRAAEERFEQRLEEAMCAAGLPPLRRTNELTRTVYSEHSEAAHHRRRWTQDAVISPLRTMIRGRTTHWLRRAGTTAALLPVVEECVMAIGSGLAVFYGPDWYERQVKPLLESFAAVGEAQPLP